MSSSNNSGEGFKILIFFCVMVFLVLYLFNLGPFEKSYTPAPTYYNNYGGGSQPSFTGMSNCNKCECPGWPVGRSKNLKCGRNLGGGRICTHTYEEHGL